MMINPRFPFTTFSFFFFLVACVVRARVLAELAEMLEIAPDEMVIVVALPTTGKVSYSILPDSAQVCARACVYVSLSLSLCVFTSKNAHLFSACILM